MSIPSEPKLAPPGAGLPLPELLIARLLFRLKRTSVNRAGFTVQFVQERAAICELVYSCETSKRGERVLIPRLRGLEDSSRNWSVWMTLDHLRITNHAFAGIITSLTNGQVPTRKASTADVKPSSDVKAVVEAEYEQSCDALLLAVAAVKEWKTAPRFAHPWFGPLDAAGWHAIAGLHMGIHRAQIARIIAGLP